MATGNLLARPVRKAAVFDLAQEAGLDMTAWIETAHHPKKCKFNPRFAFEWSFLDTQALAILCVWYDQIAPFGTTLVVQGNWREIATSGLIERPSSQRAMRAMRADQVVRHAYRDALPVRLIVCDRRNGLMVGRDLDPAPWSVQSYVDNSGDFALIRGHALPQARKKSAAQPLYLRQKTRPLRADAVRSSALRRAKGICELCGWRGFRTRNGSLYLETHHIVPISEGGPDCDRNVIALCPNHHREAHFGYAHLDLRRSFQGRMAQTKSSSSDALALAIRAGTTRPTSQNMQF